MEASSVQYFCQHNSTVHAALLYESRTKPLIYHDVNTKHSIDGPHIVDVTLQVETLIKMTRVNEFPNLNNKTRSTKMVTSHMTCHIYRQNMPCRASIAPQSASDAFWNLNQIITYA